MGTTATFLLKMIRRTWMDSTKPRLVLVNYLNTLPMLTGIQEVLADEVQIIQAHPADCARLLFSGEADIGLVPVGALVGRHDWHRVSSYGIGCRGKVETVCLFGHTPWTEWDHIYLDYQSRTSVLLTQLLVQMRCPEGMTFLPTTPGYEDRIEGGHGGLIIGDRAILARSQFPYVYDLGEWWKESTGLPFVFALWVSLQQSSDAFKTQLDRAIAHGLGKIDEVVASQQAAYPDFDLHTYYNSSIQYELDAQMMEGLDYFLKKAATMASMPSPGPQPSI